MPARLLSELLPNVLTVALGAGAPSEATSQPATTAGPVVAEIAEVREVTLPQVLERARAQGSDVLRARARVALGEAEQEAAAPLLPGNPSVSLGIGVRVNALGANPEVQVQVSQPLELAGERRLRRRAAAASRQALSRRHELATWQAEVRAWAAFELALVERRRAESAAAVEAFSRTMVDTTEALVSAGEESPLRLRLAKAELAQARQARQDADYRYRAACNRMAELAGWPPEQALRPRGELPLPDEEGTIAGPFAGGSHPAVAAAQAELEAAQAELEAARRDAWPHPSVGAYLAQEREPGTPWTSRVALATVSVPLPLWRRNQGARARAEARLGIARTERTVVARDLARQQQRARDALDTAARRLSTYADDVLPRFSDNLAQLRRAFELGEIDVLEVFVARERFLRLQDEALDVYVDYIEAARDLALASGSARDQ